MGDYAEDLAEQEFEDSLIRIYHNQGRCGQLGEDCPICMAEHLEKMSISQRWVEDIAEAEK